MVVNRYKLKDEITKKDVIAAGAMNYDGELMILKYVEVKYSDIAIQITFPEDLAEWNDEDNVLVFDTDAGVKYSLFYRARKDPATFVPKYAEDLFDEYHRMMAECGLFDKL